MNYLTHSVFHCIFLQEIGAGLGAACGEPHRRTRLPRCLRTLQSGPYPFAIRDFNDIDNDIDEFNFLEFFESLQHVASAARNPNVTVNCFHFPMSTSFNCASIPFRFNQFPSVSISFHQLVAHIYLLVGCVFHMSSLIESNGRWHSR